MAGHAQTLKEPRMGQSRTPKTTPSADPLADLREPDEPGLTPPTGPTVPGNSDPEGTIGGHVMACHSQRGTEGWVCSCPPEEPVEVRPMVTQELHDQMVAEAVAAWHQDPTAQGFLHGGGSFCGCRYMAALALRTAVPVMTEEDLEEKELEPSV